ncbi:MAG: DsbA family protein [Sphingomonas sp.]
MTATQRFSSRNMASLFIVVLIGLGIGQALQSTAQIGRDVSANPTARAALLDDISPSRVVGTPTLTVVVFTDYQCPACKVADPAMEAAVAKDGHIRLVYRDWPIFGAMSERAARIAIAADRQGIYPKLHRLLMSERRMLDDRILREAVERSGGSWMQIEKDLSAHSDEIDRQLNRNKTDAFALGIAGTPAYLIGPVLVTGAQKEAGFTRAFAEARSAAP